MFISHLTNFNKNTIICKARRGEWRNDLHFGWTDPLQLRYVQHLQLRFGVYSAARSVTVSALPPSVHTVQLHKEKIPVLFTHLYLLMWLLTLTSVTESTSADLLLPECHRSCCIQRQRRIWGIIIYRNASWMNSVTRRKKSGIIHKHKYRCNPLQWWHHKYLHKNNKSK